MKKDEDLEKILEKLGIEYKLIKNLGGGAFSNVYLMEHKVSNTLCALKVMDVRYIIETLKKINSSDNNKFKEVQIRFLKEAKFYKNIVHDNIVKIYMFGSVWDEINQIEIPYLTMEYLEGLNLEKYISNNAPLEMIKALKIAIDVLNGLDEIHKQQVVHRDIKPANIMVEEKSGKATIIDFGVAKDILSDTKLTKTGMQIGTPNYMAPEQFEDSKRVGYQIDIYSLGAVLFQMLSGELPFKGNNSFEVMCGHFHKPVPDIKVINPNLPEVINRIIQKAMAKNPNERYQNAKNFKIELMELIYGDDHRAIIAERDVATEVIVEKNYFDNFSRGSSKNFVSIDLGSETMAACCQLYGKPERININLQEFAPYLVGGDEYEIDYLETEMNGEKEKSKRLRNLVALMERRQPENLPDSHALLNFIDVEGKVVEKNGDLEYHKSLFEYFYKKGQAHSRIVLPNPKIIFQEGAGEIIPIIETINKEEIRYSPEKLLQHLLTQIIRNFVLSSSEFRNRKTKDEAGQEIEDQLILTIPNVYSLTHAENIKKYVMKHSGMGSVDIIYESDAVAYYVLDAMNESTQYEKFRSNLRRGSLDDFQILTFDIGHGTTDLSFIEICKCNSTREESRKTFYVKARSGKSHGGIRLNYIFAEYYNQCLREILDQSRFKELDPGFDFLHVREKTGFRHTTQGPILEALENFIVAIKKNMDENYIIRLSREEQAEYVDKLVDKWLNSIDANWQERTWDKQNLYDSFRQELRNVLIIDKLPGNSMRFFYESLTAIFKIQKAKLSDLIKKIEVYVKENVEDLILSLGDNLSAREFVPSPRGKSMQIVGKMIMEKPTVVVVAGQASQFKPIQKAIKCSFSKLNLPSTNLIFLKNEEAKEACCRGAVIYKNAGHLWANRNELHGTYGFMNSIRTPDYEFKILDMKALNTGTDVVLTFDYKSNYWFFYSPRAPHTFTRENPPKFFDGSTALINPFPDTQEFRVKYLKDECLIIINDIHKFKIASYGSISESIFPKVWPVVLIK
ncbi:MAG: protein kinase [Candidatus Aminicenantes bacterium]|nr:protein kinase [Candidatus Aminicenantes bacterium]